MMMSINEAPIASIIHNASSSNNVLIVVIDTDT